MRTDQQLDVSGVVSPISLALCKAALAQMAAGGVLEIRLCDQETLRDLLMIVERSQDQVLAWERHAEHYCVWVQKGPPEKPQRGRTA
jgi:TusA-related sulfurtransferase